MFNDITSPGAVDLSLMTSDENFSNTMDMLSNIVANYFRGNPIISNHSNRRTYLDVGAGTGYLTERVIGQTIPNLLNYVVEKSEHMLNLLDFRFENSNVQVQNLDIEEPLALTDPIMLDIKFDVVTCVHTLTHVFNRWHVLKNIYLSLNTGGMLLLHDQFVRDFEPLNQVQEYLDETSVDLSLIYSKELGFEGAYRPFEISELMFMLSRAGFANVDILKIEGNRYTIACVK